MEPTGEIVELLGRYSFFGSRAKLIEEFTGELASFADFIDLLFCFEKDPILF